MTLNANKTHRIWLTRDLFIRVNSSGYAVGPCFEGALGCVVQVLPAQEAIVDETRALGGDAEANDTYEEDSGNRLALKIPRLMADTVRENAYVCDILRKEEDIVFRAAPAKKNAGLVPRGQGVRHILQGRRQTREGLPDAIEQDDCILLVSFSKEHYPRFCNVKFNRDSKILEVFPPSAKADFYFINEEIWNSIEKAAKEKKGMRGFFEPAYCEIRQEPDLLPESSHAEHKKELNSDPTSSLAQPASKPNIQGSALRIGKLFSTMNYELRSTVWYAALPSVLYTWADGTLQEAISKGAHARWSIKEHYGVIASVLTGLNTLHSKGFLHADVRPANIMALGALDQFNDYLLGDYGSFSMKDIMGSLDDASAHQTGHTTFTGPGINRHRTSIFYSPERRNGVERESADTAIVLSHLPNKEGKLESANEYLVYFGWHSDLVRAGSIEQTILKKLYEQWKKLRENWSERRTISSNNGWELCRGDRLRVRDYVFTILESHVEEGSTFFRCSAQFTRVLHEKIAISSDASNIIPDQNIINIPNYVEIRQWSAATDLYGVGVLALYLIFTSGFSSNTAKDSTYKGRDMPRLAESMLGEMISILETEQNFQYLWKDLESFCQVLEKSSEVQAESKNIKSIIQGNSKGATITPLHERPVAHGINLKALGIRIVGDIRRTTKYANYLLEKFDYNVAHFLLFVHFVLACLHRRTNVLPSSENTEPSQLPFCKDRCEEAQAKGPAHNALLRLKDLMQRFEQSTYENFEVQETDIPGYSTQSDFQIRIENARLLAENIEQTRKLQDETTVFQERARAANSRLETLRTSKEELASKLSRSEREAERIQSQLTTCEKGVEELKKKVDKQSNSLENTINEKGQLKGKLEEKSSRLVEVEKMLKAIREVTNSFEPSTFGNADKLLYLIRQKLD